MTIHHLRVANLGLIADSAFDIGSGMTVITGETGTGKTLLLGGIRLLRGDRSDAALVGTDAPQAQVDGLIEAESGELAVTRVIPRDGRSRSYLNGVMVSAEVLADKVGTALEVVGQHDQLLIRQQKFLLALLDAQHSELRDDYETAWRELQEALRAEQSLGGDEMALRRELDLTSFQAGEIEASAILSGEDEALEAEASRLNNLDEIRIGLSEVDQVSDSLSEMIGEVVGRLRKVANLDATVSPDEAEAVAEMIADLTRTVRDHIDRLEADPQRQEWVNQRLTQLGDLKRKYGPTLDQVIRFGEEAQERSAEITDLLGRSGEIAAEVAAARDRVEATGRKLSAARRQVGAVLAEAAGEHLRDLAMADPRLEFRIETVASGSTGCDRVELWFSSDSRLEMAPIGSGASGGELSRLVLAVRLAARGANTQTLVFDEVDTGVGGSTALAMGRKLSELAETCQVLCVTHLPQVAAFANNHIVVNRSGGSASIAILDDEGRIAELARMLAGIPDSVASREAATELLAMAAR